MVLGVRTGRSGVGVPPSGHGNQRHGAGLAGRATGARVRRGEKRTTEWYSDKTKGEET